MLVLADASCAHAGHAAQCADLAVGPRLHGRTAVAVTGADGRHEAGLISRRQLADDTGSLKMLAEAAGAVKIAAGVWNREATALGLDNIAYALDGTRGQEASIGVAIDHRHGGVHQVVAALDGEAERKERAEMVAVTKHVHIFHHTCELDGLQVEWPTASLQICAQGS